MSSGSWMVVLRSESSGRGDEGKSPERAAAVSYDACRAIESPSPRAAVWDVASGVGSGVVPLRTSRAISPITIWPVRGAKRTIRLMSFRGPPASSQGIHTA